MSSSELAFSNSNNGEISQEILTIRSSHFGEETVIYKCIKDIGSTFCDIISLDCEAIENIMNQFIPKDYKVKTGFDTDMISRAILGEGPTKEEKALKKQEELFLQALIDYNHIFSIYGKTRIFDSIIKALADIKKYREYAELCMVDEFYLNADFLSFLCDIEKILFYRSPDLPEEYDKSTASSKDFLTLRKDYEKMLKDGSPVTQYNASSFGDICAASLMELGKKKFIIKKCENCHKYFIPYLRSDTIYCDRTSPRDINRTCKEYGSERLWYDKLKNNQSSKLYRNIYQSKQMLAKRNLDIIEYSESFEKFKIQSKQWKSDIKAGTKSEEEFIEWLKVAKEKKVL